MKKILYAIFAIIVLFSCDRELEFGSDFEFQIRNIDDNEIYINTLKSFQLEILSTKNVTNNKNYKFSYSVVGGGELTVKDGSSSLIEGNEYNYTVNDLNLISLDLIPESAGEIRVKFSLSDNNGVLKSKEIIVYCTDEDFGYTFTGVAPNPNGNVNVGIPFSLNIVNTGLSANSFQVKYISSSLGTVTIGGSAMPYNTYFNTASGTIGGLYTSSNIGTHDVTFTCIDLNGQEIQVVLTFNITASPFSLAKLSNFSVKNTLKKEFKFILTNTLSSATYQVKFTSLNPSKIFKGTTQLNMSTWINLNLDPTNLYSYDYEANSDVNDVLSVEVKDNYGQTQTINYDVTVFARPSINNFNVSFIRNPVTSGFNSFSCNGNTKSNTLNTITGGATLVKTKLIIRNKLTGAYDTLEFNNNLIQNQLEYVSSYCSTSGWGSTCTSSSVFSGCFNQSKYAGQLYSIQIQDSDGVWSTVSSGTCIVI